MTKIKNRLDTLAPDFNEMVEDATLTEESERVPSDSQKPRNSLVNRRHVTFPKLDN